jgi:asparagine synthase (glutamine-hydrolysing)
MCGILALLNARSGQQDKVRYHLSMLTHRGPDATGLSVLTNKDGTHYLGHTRLSIVDPESGAQPFETPRGSILAVNGEIYNCGFLNTKHKGHLKTRSDCECIAHLYDHMHDVWPAQFTSATQHPMEKLCCMLNGVYAFVCMNVENNKIWAARDPLGVVPLYYGYNRDGTMAFASEMKALNGLVDTVSEFPPGHYYNSSDNSFKKYYKPGWVSQLCHGNGQYGWPVWNKRLDRCEQIQLKLEDAVEQRMMTDVPWGVLLSGGLDSSIIAALAAASEEKAFQRRINTFSIGLEGSPDLAAAEVMAKHIGSKHRSYIFTVEEALNAIPEVIRHLETYDVTTIRAGVPMYLIARHIKATGTKMVLSGEGADEIYGGYMYFHNCPNWEEFQHETQRKIFDLHYYDCLRANKSMAAWGVECRVPFLDMTHVEYAMRIHPSAKMPREERMEKHILRESFAHLLPKEICWRQKEQFSDGVGYDWIDSIKKMAKATIGANVWSSRCKMFPTHTPKTYEAMYYRLYFDKYFRMPGVSLLVPYGKSCACSSDTAARWAGNETDDASGRSVKKHIKSVV